MAYSFPMSLYGWGQQPFGTFGMRRGIGPMHFGYPGRMFGMFGSGYNRDIPDAMNPTDIYDGIDLAYGWFNRNKFEKR